MLDSEVLIFCFPFCAAFGFCEYKEPESTLRALRLLHDMQIGEKKLLVKVDAKTKAQLDEWKASRPASNGVGNKCFVLVQKIRDLYIKRVQESSFFFQ